MALKDTSFQRKIIHLDMDCFFAAVEIADNPHLKNKAVAVGGSPDQRGVIATCNYIAREYGVRSAMSSAEAIKRCPHLVVFPPNIAHYREVSRQVRKIFHSYTDIVEPLSLDEAYLDVSGITLFKGSATLIARDIRRAIYESTGLTASAGIATCKFLAKIASDENKPDGQCVITPDIQDAFVKKLPLEKIPGVGKVTQRKLEQLRWKTCNDIQQTASLKQLIDLFGVFGKVLWERCHGMDTRPVKTHREVKSLSVENTFVNDLHSSNECQQQLQPLVNKLYQRFVNYKKTHNINSCRVKLTFSDFSKTTAEQTVSGWSFHPFYNLLHKALERQTWQGVRLIGVGVGLEPASGQLDLSL